MVLERSSYMLPTINKKSFLECNEEDLKVLIDNPDYRENEYIDYKKNFSFLEIPKDKKDMITREKYEFRSDVCSFANAGGGYLVVGISDDNGCASELCGIDILNDNTDKFELERRNDLTGIQPKSPYLKFSFVKLESGKYIVIIYIKHDSFAPYLHIENEKDYQVFRRTGNKKATMTYTELRNMFNQSLSLDKEIYNYRKERIQYYREQSEEKDDTYSKFLLLHIIPDTFTDPSFNRNMFIIEKQKRISFGAIFNYFGCNDRHMPCVDGLHFLHDEMAGDKSEGFIYNNGVVELFYPLYNHLGFKNNKYINCFFPYEYIWDRIEILMNEYKNTFRKLKLDEKTYICLSIVGCKGAMTQDPDQNMWLYYGAIDRDSLLCNPVIIENLNDDDSFLNGIKLFHIDYLQSIGVKLDKQLDQLMKEVYGI